MGHTNPATTTIYTRATANDTTGTSTTSAGCKRCPHTEIGAVAKIGPGLSMQDQRPLQPSARKAMHRSGPGCQNLDAVDRVLPGPQRKPSVMKAVTPGCPSLLPVWHRVRNGSMMSPVSEHMFDSRSTTLMDETKLKLLALCALRADGHSVDWSLIAREAVRPDGIDRMWSGELMETSKSATTSLPLLLHALSTDVSDAQLRVEQELALAARAGATLVTILDDDYPANLRFIPNLPPFLFVLGGPITPRDAFSVAVVGTRDATAEGLSRAGQMATRLVEHGVTVVSGLAKGIDTAALTAALAAQGRTIGVIGTGITKAYPKENAELQQLVAAGGAVVSQFWPSSGPATWTFPRRNVVMSGISQGTVVIEASSTSGAKMQARLALEHGKQVFLVRSLVMSQEWARKYADRPGAVVVERVEDVVDNLAAADRVFAAANSRQLTLNLA
jgi:DNA processing protein